MIETQQLLVICGFGLICFILAWLFCLTSGALVGIFVLSAKRESYEPIFNRLTPKKSSERIKKLGGNKPNYASEEMKRKKMEILPQKPTAVTEIQEKLAEEAQRIPGMDNSDRIRKIR